MHNQKLISWDRTWWRGWGDDHYGNQRIHGRWLSNGVLRNGTGRIWVGRKFPLRQREESEQKDEEGPAGA